MLKTAEELRIKGLAEVSWRDDDSENPESNDSNNNVTDTTANSFSHLNQTPISTNSNHISGSANGVDRRDNKENLLKTIPFLAPLSSPKDLSSSSRKKRGRPPLDESNHFTRA